MKCPECGHEMKDLGDELYCPNCTNNIHKWRNTSIAGNDKL